MQSRRTTAKIFAVNAACCAVLLILLGDGVARPLWQVIPVMSGFALLMTWTAKEAVQGWQGKGVVPTLKGQLLFTSSVWLFVFGTLLYVLAGGVLPGS